MATENNRPTPTITDSVAHELENMITQLVGDTDLDHNQALEVVQDAVRAISNPEGLTTPAPTLITVHVEGEATVMPLTEVSIPDLWHAAMRVKGRGGDGNAQDAALILHLWHLAHDLKRNLEDITLTNL